MIEQTALVVSVQGDLAEVEGERQGTCGGCAGEGACTTSLIARYFGRSRPVLQVENPIGARPGDRVTIGLAENTLLTASFLAYLAPLLAMIGAAIAGAQIADFLAPDYVRGLSILAGLGGLVATLGWLTRLSRAGSLATRCRPRILRWAGEGGDGLAVRFQDQNPTTKSQREPAGSYRARLSSQWSIHDK
jgi:sigma-E factor negative regulatory protein RseC